MSALFSLKVFGKLKLWRKIILLLIDAPLIDAETIFGGIKGAGKKLLHIGGAENLWKEGKDDIK